MKQSLLIISFIILIIFLTGLDLQVGPNMNNDHILSDVSFIDQSGVIVEQDNRDVSIVSLSPIHTENLFEIGAGAQLVGVDSQSIYPIEALAVQSFRINKKWDIDALIKLKPDYVLIEPVQKEQERKLVATLESNHIKVITLLPESMAEFDAYIIKLGILSGHQHEAKLRLDQYKQDLDLLMSQVEELKTVKTIMVETSEKGYLIPSQDHMINNTVELAGGYIVRPKKTIFNRVANEQIKVGKDYILNHDESIDSYFTITGAPYSGASLVSFSQKTGFNELSAYKNNKVYSLSNTMLGHYTFRYIEGIKEFHRLMFNNESNYKAFNEELDGPLTRLSFAKIVYDYYHLPTYINADNQYYEFAKFQHTYGAYQDVKFNHTWYHVIETVTMKGYLLPQRRQDNTEYFGAQELLTREELVLFLTIRLNTSLEESQMLMRSILKDQQEGYTNEDLFTLLDSINGDEIYD